MIKITLENSKKRILVNFPFASDRVSKIRTIKGRLWYSEEKVWSIPYSLEAIKKCLELFQDEEMVIAPEILNNFEIWELVSNICKESLLN